MQVSTDMCATRRNLAYPVIVLRRRFLRTRMLVFRHSPSGKRQNFGLGLLHGVCWRCEAALR